MTQPKESVYTIVLTQIDDALKELASSKPKAVGGIEGLLVWSRFRLPPLLEALQVAQSYLLTLPQGADRKILDRINDAIKKPPKPQELKETFESLQAYLLTLKVPDEPDNGMKCKHCGCTDDNACEGGCSWVAKNVCSKCAAKLVSVIKMPDGVILRTEGNPKSPRPTGCSIQTNNLFDHQIKDVFVPVEVMIITANNLLNAYQEITGGKIWLKPITGEKIWLKPSTETRNKEKI